MNGERREGGSGGKGEDAWSDKVWEYRKSQIQTLSSKIVNLTAKLLYSCETVRLAGQKTWRGDMYMILGEVL